MAGQQRPPGQLLYNLITQWGDDVADVGLSLHNIQVQFYFEFAKISCTVDMRKFSRRPSELELLSLLYGIQEGVRANFIETHRPQRICGVNEEVSLHD